MKTILSHLNTLTEPERSEALENVENDTPHWLNDNEGSVYKALCTLFYWDETQQGQEYWERIAEKYRNK